MPFFKVVLLGKGILLRCEDDEDPAIGFYTTRVVKARDPVHAQALAKGAVLAEWQAGGEYAEANTGSVPLLTTENIHSVGFLRGVFCSKPTGYSFYLRDD
jgi:hypothetical protein